ncbi:MAG: FAD:protein FMN transferase [Acetivibrionales bacterium]
MQKHSKKITGVIITFFLILLVMVGCSKGIAGAAPDEYKRHDFAMGTPITQRVYGKNGEKAAEQVIEKIRDIESRMTVNAPGGEINHLNDSAGIDGVRLSEDTLYVLEKAGYYSQLSGGSFDITVGPLIKAWGIVSENSHIPEKQDIQNMLRLVDYRNVSINKANMTAKLERKGQNVDLGAIVKGFAGDEAVKIYKENGINSAFINLGGNVVVVGNKPDGSHWRIGVQNPRAVNGKYIGIIEVSDKAVVTSGDYERYFESGGKRYHHILDPKTGYPSDSGLISVTVVSGTSIDADALSTSLFVMGLEKGYELAEAINGIEAIFITEQKEVYTTNGLRDSFSFSDESKEYKYVEKR